MLSQKLLDNKYRIKLLIISVWISLHLCHLCVFLCKSHYIKKDTYGISLFCFFCSVFLDDKYLHVNITNFTIDRSRKWEEYFHQGAIDEYLITKEKIIYYGIKNILQ